MTRDGAPRCGRREPRYPDADEVTYECHDAEVVVRVETGTIESSLDGDHTGQTIADDDPAWPATCACGYAFTAGDSRQENRTRLHARSDGGPPTTVDKAPAGALYDAAHFHDAEGYTRNGPGMSLVCKTPAGIWLIDGPANNGPGWTRTGIPPDIVVTPSIGVGQPQRLHGWLGGPGHDEPGWLVIDSP
jgi:hypothetical protein